MLTSCEVLKARRTVLVYEVVLVSKMKDEVRTQGVEDPKSCSGWEVPSYWPAANLHCHVENIDSFLLLMKQQSLDSFWLLWDSRKWARDINRLSADSKSFCMAAEQAEEMIVIPGLWDVFMQSLILALVYLPGIRALWYIHQQSGSLVH